MKRIDAEKVLSNRFASCETIATAAHVQAGETLEEINQKTLTIRDQFALAAMQSIIGVYDRSGFQPAAPAEIAKRAYIYAEAMMEARKK